MNNKMKIAIGAAVATLMLGGVGVAYAQTGGPGKDPVTPQAEPQDQAAQAFFRRGGMVSGAVKQIDGTTLVLSLPNMMVPQDQVPPGQPNGRFENQKGKKGDFQPPQKRNQQPGRPANGRQGQPNQAVPAQPDQPAKPAPAAREVRVQTNAETVFYVPGKASPTLADLKIGDRVAVLLVAPSKPADKANKSETGAPPQNLVAKAVAVIPLPQSIELNGRAADVTAAGFNLAGPRGTELSAIKILPATKFVLAGVPGATISSLKNDDPVLVIGKPTGDKSVDAALVIDQPMSRTANFAGMVASVSGNTIVLWQINGQQLTVNAASAIFLKGMDINGTIADVRVGMPTRVIGAKSGDTVTAQIVMGGPAFNAKDQGNKGPGNMRRP